MADNPTGVYTFYPEFTEHVVLYRGVVRVWIDEYGMIYAEYVDGQTQVLGPASSYAEAVQSGYAGEGTAYPTRESWVQHIIETTQNALNAEAWAVGTEGGLPVTSSDPSEPSSTNNSKYYCQISETAKTASEAAQTASETAQAAAEDSQKAAEAWAVGQINGTNVPISDPRHHNNSKYYSEQAVGSASASAFSASNSADSAAAAAGSATNAAGSASAASTSAENAATSASNAHTSEVNAASSEANASGSEANAALWATGGSTGTPSATNNALYYANQAKLWANNGTEGTPSASNNAKQYAANASDSADEAKQWANWNVAGNPSATNNAKTYSDNSAESALQSESWAVGTRNGQADNVRTGADTNNAHYWATEAASSATDAASSESNAASSATAAASSASSASGSASSASTSASNAAASESNASTSASNAGTYAANASTSASNASSSATAAAGSEASAALSASTAAQWATGGSSGTPSATNNALYYATLAGTRADSVRGAFVQTTYQNSMSGTIVPTGTWNSSPSPQNGMYMWTRNILTWNDLSTHTFYSVAYNASSQGSVTSVNGLSGAVTVDGRNVYVDSSSQTPTTLQNAIGAKLDANDIITDLQIDSLFNEE